MNQHATNPFARMRKDPPSSAGYPAPKDGTPLPPGLRALSSSAGRKSEPGKGGDAEGKDARDFADILAEARREAHEEKRGEAVRSTRSRADKLGACPPPAAPGVRPSPAALDTSPSPATLDALSGLVDSLTDIAPFGDDRLSRRLEDGAAGLAPEEWGAAGDGGALARWDVELDPAKWGTWEDGAAADPADGFAELDPAKWGAREDEAAGHDPQSRGLAAEPGPGKGRAAGRDALLNPTVIAARYEKEAEAAREGGWHHALNDFPTKRYNEIVRASNDVALLWEGALQATAYDLVKSLVLRTVLTDDELAGRVLGECAGFLDEVKSQAAPMLDLWHEEAALEPPAKRR